MMLRKIKLRNFRKFEELDFTFPEENLLVLTGPNGSGKSTILDAIAKCLAHYVGKMVSHSDVKYSSLDSLSATDITNGEIKTYVSCGFDFFGYGTIEVSKRRDQDNYSYKFKEGLTRFIHQLLNPNYFPVFYECANPPFPVLTFCPRFLIKSPFYESFLMETQRENGRNIDFLMTGHIPPIEVFRPLVRITISP